MMPLRLLPLLGVILACIARAETFKPGEVHFGRERYIEYRVGDLPIILTAGHGGMLSPEEIPDRTAGTFATDRNTLEISIAAYEEIVARTGARPHLILCHLRRRKVDMNRPIEEAAQGNPLGETAWREYHGFIATARAAVSSQHGRGALFDIHGHGHAIARVELGYALGAQELDRPDEELDREEFVQLSTLRSLARLRPGIPLSRLVRGEGSFGDLLMRRGVPAWPSPQFPTLGDAPFFRGGYTVRFHSRADDGTAITAIQAELPFPGIRDTEDSRARFASAFASATLEYLSAPETFALNLPSTGGELPPAIAADGEHLGCGDDCAPIEHATPGNAGPALPP